MGIRPAKCYRRLERPWTRVSQSKPKKSYVKGVPDSKIHRFEMGSKKSYPLVAKLVSNQTVQIRDVALEAMRIALNKHLDKALGKDNYFFKILVFPHHVLRENPLATGAGADRFQTGMRLSFGKPIGRATQVVANQPVLMVRVDEGKNDAVKKAMKIASSKLPTTCSVMFEKTD